MPHDARAVANFLLDYADSLHKPITHMSLQKIIFFIHGWHYAYFNTPLIKNGFEAWEHGPVVSCVYDSFKESADQAISSRAFRFDVINRKKILVGYNFLAPQQKFIQDNFLEYSYFSAYQLRELSHETGGPWDSVRNCPKNGEPVGLRIPEKSIEIFFKNALVNTSKN